MNRRSNMGKLAGSFWMLLFMLMLSGPQEVKAQGFFSRLFMQGSTGSTHSGKKAIRHIRFQCGDMDAYNKQRAFKKHKRGRPWKIAGRRSSGSAEKGPVAEKGPEKLTPPPKTANAGNPKPQQDPPQKPAPETPGPVTDSPPPVAKKSTVPPEKSDPVPVEKKDDPLLSRNALKKMTLKERRDTLQHTEPAIVLEPIQFISDQDEFSVVNMDSFMKAMEYAQEGKVVLVEGHTDDLGSDKYNLDLSMKRAEKIRELLLSGGVSDELISVIGYGERQPLVPNTNTENRAINRRIEFKIFSLQE